MADAREEYQHIADLFALRPGVARSQMFGMPCLKVNGKAFVTLVQDVVVFKLPEADRARALELPGSVLFDPMGNGRKMKEWVQVPLAQAQAWEGLADAACRYVAALAGKGQ